MELDSSTDWIGLHWTNECSNTCQHFNRGWTFDLQRISSIKCHSSAVLETTGQQPVSHTTANTVVRHVLAIAASSNVTERWLMPGHNYRLPKIETIEIPREGLTQGQTAGTGIVFVVYTVNCRLACRGTESLTAESKSFVQYRYSYPVAQRTNHRTSAVSCT